MILFQLYTNTGLIVFHNVDFTHPLSFILDTISLNRWGMGVQFEIRLMIGRLGSAFYMHPGLNCPIVLLITIRTLTGFSEMSDL